MSIIANSVTITDVVVQKQNNSTRCNYVFARNANETAHTQYNWKYVYDKYSDVTELLLSDIWINSWNMATQKIEICINRAVLPANDWCTHFVIGCRERACGGGATSNNRWLDVIFRESPTLLANGPMLFVPNRFANWASLQQNGHPNYIILIIQFGFPLITSPVLLKAWRRRYAS